MSIQHFVKEWIDRVYGGSTKAAAEATGFAQRTIQSWMSGDRTPSDGVMTLLRRDFQMRKMLGDGPSTTAADDQNRGRRGDL